MQIEVLKSKIHRVTITEANLNYVGSITIDEELMEAANLIEGERVQIWNVTNGERLDTYVIRGRRGSGAICLNGAAARKAQVGDVLIIASYARMEFEEAKTFRPWVVFPDTATNRLVEKKRCGGRTGCRGTIKTERDGRIPLHNGFPLLPRRHRGLHCPRPARPCAELCGAFLRLCVQLLR